MSVVCKTSRNLRSQTNFHGIKYIKSNIYLFIIIIIIIIIIIWWLYHRYWALSILDRTWFATNPQSELVTTKTVTIYTLSLYIYIYIYMSDIIYFSSPYSEFNVPQASSDGISFHLTVFILEIWSCKSSKKNYKILNKVFKSFKHFLFHFLKIIYCHYYSY